MARISRQIGWSNESNILYQILNQLTRLAGIITGLKPAYKVYTAIYTQNGVTPGDAPTLVNVLENTITPGDTPIITYSNIGIFDIIFSSTVLTTTKTFVICDMWADDGSSPLPSAGNIIDDSTIRIGNTSGNDAAYYIAVEIRVYN